MSFIVVCPNCGASYARMLLTRKDPRCRCGQALNAHERNGPTRESVTSEGAAPEARPTALEFVDRDALVREEAKLRELIRLADRVAFLIVATDTPQIDVAIQRAELRRKCLELFPDKIHVYEMIYESRFERLWEQFRAA